MYDWVLFALLAAFFSSALIFTEKKILFKENPLEFTAMLYFFGLILLLTQIYRLDFTTLDTTALFLIFVRSILMTLGFFFLVKSIAKLEVSVVSPLMNLSPVVALIFSFIFLQEVITIIQLTGVLFLLFGAYLLQVAKYKDMLMPFKEFYKSDYMYYLFMVYVCFSLSGILGKFFFTMYEDFSVTLYTLVSYFFSFTFASIILFTYHHGFKQFIIHLREYGPFALLASMFDLASTFSFLKALAIPTSKVSLLYPIWRLETLFVVLFAGKLFKENNLQQKLTATFIMLIGVFLIVS